MVKARYWLIVPAGGIGRRFSPKLPKQFFPLGQSNVAQQCLSRLLKVPQMDRLIVPCKIREKWWSSVPATKNHRVELVEGGLDRAESVLNGLLALAKDATSSDWVLVHDIVRPCVTVGSIMKLRESVHRHPIGGILVSPTSDTVKLISEHGQIKTTLDRRYCRLAQTPQMFRYGELLEAMEYAIKHKKAVTDESSALEQLGKTIKMVEGRADNVKITWAEDLIFADAIIKEQAKLECE